MKPGEACKQLVLLLLSGLALFTGWFSLLQLVVQYSLLSGLVQFRLLNGLVQLTQWFSLVYLVVQSSFVSGLVQFSQCFSLVYLVVVGSSPAFTFKHIKSPCPVYLGLFRFSSTKHCQSVVQYLLYKGHCNEVGLV